MKSCFEDTGLLKEGVDRFWGGVENISQCSAQGGQKGTLWFESEENEVGKGERKRLGAEKGRRKGNGKKKALSSSAKRKV